MLLLLPALPLAKMVVLAGLMACPAHQPPVVTLDLRELPTEIDNAKTSVRLAEMKAHAISPNYGAEFPIVGGLTESSFELAYNTGFVTASGRNGKACLWAERVHITLTYAPKIYIALQYAPGSCNYSLTKRHEQRHVYTDLASLNEFAPRLRKVAGLAAARWRVIGPIDKGRLKTEQAEMTDALARALDNEIASLHETRRLRQQKIDSREEYKRMSKACRGKD